MHKLSHKSLKQIILRLSLVLGLAFLLGLLHSVDKKVASAQSSTSQTIAAQIQPIDIYAQELKKQEIELWQKLENVGIKQEACAQLEKKYANTLDKMIRKNRKTISAETKNLITTVLTDFDIDPTTISLVTYTDDSPAAAVEKIIFVDEINLKKFSKAAQKFIIAHELQHIIYKDIFKRTAFEDLIPKHKKSALKSRQHPVNQFYRFQEKRADIYTACKNKEYAQGYIDFIKQRLENGDTPGITHPKSSERLALGQEIFKTCYEAQPVKQLRGNGLLTT
jgi:predicted metal-dependent hydrolase